MDNNLQSQRPETNASHNDSQGESQQSRAAKIKSRKIKQIVFQHGFTVLIPVVSILYSINHTSGVLGIALLFLGLSCGAFATRFELINIGASHAVANKWFYVHVFLSMLFCGWLWHETSQSGYEFTKSSPLPSAEQKLIESAQTTPTRSITNSIVPPNNASSGLSLTPPNNGSGGSPIDSPLNAVGSPGSPIPNAPLRVVNSGSLPTNGNSGSLPTDGNSGSLPTDGIGNSNQPVLIGPSNNNNSN
jgi:hypothetical protein